MPLKKVFFVCILTGPAVSSVRCDAISETVHTPAGQEVQKVELLDISGGRAFVTEADLEGPAVFLSETTNKKTIFWTLSAAQELIHAIMNESDEATKKTHLETICAYLASAPLPSKGNRPAHDAMRQLFKKFAIQPHDLDRIHARWSLAIPHSAGPGKIASHEIAEWILNLVDCAIIDATTGDILTNHACSTDQRAQLRAARSAHAYSLPFLYLSSNIFLNAESKTIVPAAKPKAQSKEATAQELATKTPKNAKTPSTRQKSKKNPPKKSIPLLTRSKRNVNRALGVFAFFATIVTGIIGLTTKKAPEPPAKPPIPPQKPPTPPAKPKPEKKPKPAAPRGRSNSLPGGTQKKAKDPKLVSSVDALTTDAPLLAARRPKPHPKKTTGFEPPQTPRRKSSSPGGSPEGQEETFSPPPSTTSSALILSPHRSSAKPSLPLSPSYFARFTDDDDKKSPELTTEQVLRLCKLRVVSDTSNPTSPLKNILRTPQALTPMDQFALSLMPQHRKAPSASRRLEFTGNVTDVFNGYFVLNGTTYYWDEKHFTETQKTDAHEPLQEHGNGIAAYYIFEHEEDKKLWGWSR